MKDEPGAPVDRLLAGTLKARADAAPEGACLDAETLAAWADEALDARERASVEAHAAECARCQALLASMVKTAPAPIAAASWWRIPALGWLVPLTVAATALVIWIAVPERAPVQHSQDAAELSEPAAPAPRATLSADARARLQAPPPPATIPETREAALEKQKPESVLEKKVLPVPSQSADAPAENANAARAASSAGAAADSVAPLRSAAPAAPSATEPAARREALAASRLSTFASAPESIIASSNPSTRFRLLRGGGVQRTADAGATWRTENTGATDTLTAGSSPSPSVCWLVGPSGAVFLSTDGRFWRRLAFPEAVDLRSVVATDGENATVTTADGRSFITTDSGRTWSRPQGH